MLPDLLHFQRDFTAALDGPATGAMAVYRNTVFHGAVEALRANYPVIEQILGEEMFSYVVVDFASSSPPRSPILALYGEEFAEWLRRQKWVGDLPYLPDVARVEHLHIRCLFAADTATAFCDHNGGPTTTLRLHPAVQFTWTSTPAMSIWLAHQQTVGSKIEPAWKPEGALFARPSPFVLHALRIGRAAHRILSGIRLGETISAARAAASRLYPDENCASVFASLINLGLFADPTFERTN